jgi:hypothetical protein
VRVWAISGLARAELYLKRLEQAEYWMQQLDPDSVPEAALLYAIAARLKVERKEWVQAWNLACTADRRIENRVYARGIHFGTLSLLCDVFTRLAQGLQMERELLLARTAARLNHLQQHLQVAPIVEPACCLFRARFEGKPELLQRARDAARRLEMPLVGALEELA